MAHERPERPTLVPFSRRHAERVARWVRDPDELRRLAPATQPPLTGAKVLAWHTPKVRPYLLWGEAGQPIGYGELNLLSPDGSRLWMGHVVLDPARRGLGLGLLLVRALLGLAFGRLGAARVTLIVCPGNRAAVRVYLRAGFRVSARETYRFGGRPAMAMLRMECVPGTVMEMPADLAGPRADCADRSNPVISRPELTPPTR